ncbi:hypothetical protein JTB14_009216 [Gonioctena quinquepunctata]|nr:hypothetical protein JTB14_009216 [Gonioctena quinquepunctata]
MNTVNFLTFSLLLLASIPHQEDSSSSKFRQKKNKKERRYTQEDKLLALTLYKQSPKGYRILQKLFTLPTKTTLNRMLGSISIDCGLNNNILTSLKESVEKMQKEQKVSLLMFNEISSQPGSAYSKTMDNIIGFEDFGESCRNEKFADRALVFIVKGVFANWKQPIAYYFIDDSLKGHGLAVKINEVITALQAAQRAQGTDVHIFFCLSISEGNNHLSNQKTTSVLWYIGCFALQ